MWKYAQQKFKGCQTQRDVMVGLPLLGTKGTAGLAEHSHPLESTFDASAYQQASEVLGQKLLPIPLSIYSPTPFVQTLLRYRCEFKLRNRRRPFVGYAVFVELSLRRRLD